MKKLFIGLGLVLSINTFASDSCTIKNKKGFHPDGTPSTRIVLECTDVDLQQALLSRYESYRIGDSSMFLKEIKGELVKDILAAGYIKINNGIYMKN